MKKYTYTFVILLLAGILSLCTTVVLADTAPTITIETVSAEPGEPVQVAVIMENNPGIAGLTLTISYDAEAVTLESVSDGGVFDILTYSKPNLSKNPFSVSWLNMSDDQNDTANGEILYMNFTVHDAAVESCNISVTKSVISDAALNDVEFTMVPGRITVTGSKPAILKGDVNSDGSADDTDAEILMRYFAGWNGYAEQILDYTAADIDGNGVLTRKDAMILSRHLAGWEQYDDLFAE